MIKLIIDKQGICIILKKIVYRMQLGVGYKLNPISPKRTRPLREEVYELLRQNILLGVHKPGDWLREEELSRNFGISRTPIREAFRKLEMDGFITYQNNKGSLVSEVYRDDLSDIYDIRAFVECCIIRKAVRNVTLQLLEQLKRNIDDEAKVTKEEEILSYSNEFNELIFSAAKNQALVNVAKFLRDMTARVKYRYHVTDSRRNESRKEHIKIYEALESGSEIMAEQAVHQHIINAKIFAQNQESRKRR